MKFYDLSKSNSTDSGFLYYPPKPYLLIEQSEKGISTKLISLPDLSRPHRLKHNEGLGSAEMGFEIDNGMIRSFNSKSDSKGPETITALTGIGTAKAALITAEAAMATATRELQPIDSSREKSVENTYDVVIVKDAIETLKKVIATLASAPSKGIYAREISILKREVSSLEKISSIHYDTQMPDDLISKLEQYRKLTEKSVDELSGVKVALEVYSVNPNAYPRDFSYALEAKTSLDEPIRKLKGFSSRSASVVGLYEIEFISGKLALRKVTLE